MLETRTYYYHGKLLLTGEYLVLDGATALAVPTRYGQHFTVRPMLRDNQFDLEWSIATLGSEEPARYFFRREDWAHSRLDPDPVKGRLQQLFYAAEQLKPRCTYTLSGRIVDSVLEFDPEWGLGSSSTLVAFLAEYLGVNAYDLLTLSFDGSGYDLACANATGPVLYTRRGSDPVVEQLTWHPEWLSRTYFVHLNQKQNSREGIAAYRATKENRHSIEFCDRITSALRDALHLRAAAPLIQEHESLIAGLLNMQPVKERLFGDFPGEIKSLGAWGGDFVWVLSELTEEKVRKYFNERGYQTVIPYDKMVL